MGYDNYGWGRYVSVSERKANAKKMATTLKAKGHITSPVELKGRTIARTFWGKAWCDNLESYSDFANRLSRGKRYVRNGSVFDLQISTGKAKALVSGSDIYTVEITIKQVSKARWDAICEACAGQFGSLVELLQGRFDASVMKVLVEHTTGLFPAPSDISLSCSCPDWADMCKHVAAALYGVGARLDNQPELLFRLRGVDEADLLASVDQVTAFEEVADLDGDLGMDDLSSLFGIEMDDSDIVLDIPVAASTPRKRKSKKSATKSTKTARSQKATKRAATTPTQKSTVAARELTAQGIPRTKIQYWLRTGVIERTDKRGVYQKTDKTDAKIREVLGVEEKVAAPVTVAARELTEQGISHAKIQYWLRTGVIERTGERGVYQKTDKTDAKVQEVLGVESKTTVPVTVTARELAAQGIPHTTVRYWLSTGVLERTEEPDVYQKTPRTQASIKDLLKRK